MRSITELVLSVQDRCSLPLEDGDRFNRAAVIRVMNEVMEEEITPKLFAGSPDFLTQRLVLPLVVNGVAKYPNRRIPVPSRAYGRSIREVKYLPNGETSRQAEINVVQTSIDEFDAFKSTLTSGTTPNIMCYFEGDSINISLDPNTGGSIVIYYTIKPNVLKELTTNANPDGPLGAITAISGQNLNMVGVPNLDGKTYSVSNKTVVDIFRKSTGTLLAADVEATFTSISLPNSTLSTTLDINFLTELAAYQQGGLPIVSPYASDLFVTSAGYCSYSLIPPEFDHVLVLETCARIMESLGDAEMLGVIQAQLKKAYNSIVSLTGNRLPGQKKRVTDNRSIAKQQRFRQWGRGNFNYR